MRVTWRRSLLVSALCGLPLAGCSTDTSLLGKPPLGTLGPAEQTPLQNIGARSITRMVGFRPPVGPPDAVNAELSRQLNDAATDQGIALISDPNIMSDLMLRGYVSALRKGTSVNLSFLWDVLDSRGQRVTRFEGEETLTGNADIKQPWDAMNPAVSRVIAQRTMTDLSNWLKTYNKPSGLPAPSTAGASTVSAPTPAAGVAFTPPQR